jgi:hypothetical protein
MSEDSKQSQSHIDSIVRQEEEALERRSSSERHSGSRQSDERSNPQSLNRTSNGLPSSYDTHTDQCILPNVFGVHLRPIGPN